MAHAGAAKKRAAADDSAASSGLNAHTSPAPKKAALSDERIPFCIWESVFDMMLPCEHSKYAMVCDTWASICLRLARLELSVSPYALHTVPLTRALVKSAIDNDRVTMSTLTLKACSAGSISNVAYIRTMLYFYASPVYGKELNSSVSIEGIAKCFRLLGDVNWMRAFQNAGLSDRDLIKTLASMQIKEHPDVKEYILTRLPSAGELPTVVYAIPDITVDEIRQIKSRLPLRDPTGCLTTCIRNNRIDLLKEEFANQLRATLEIQQRKEMGLGAVYRTALERVLGHLTMDMFTMITGYAPTFFNLSNAILTRDTRIVSAVHANDRDLLERHFHLAVTTGSAEIMTQLLAIYHHYTEHRPNPLNAHDVCTLWGTACYTNRLDIAEMIWTNFDVDVARYELQMWWRWRDPLEPRQVFYMTERIASKRPWTTIETECLSNIATQQNMPEIITYMVQKGMYIHPKAWESVLARKNRKLANLLRAHDVAITPAIIAPFVWSNNIESLKFMASVGYTPGNSDFPSYNPDLAYRISAKTHDFLREHQERWAKNPNWARVMISDEEEKEREIAWRTRDIPEAEPDEEWNVEEGEEVEEMGEEEEEEEEEAEEEEEEEEDA